MHMEALLYIKKGKEPEKDIVQRTCTPSQQKITTAPFQQDREKGMISAFEKL